jgi:hypothetical protein
MLSGSFVYDFAFTPDGCAFLKILEVTNGGWYTTEISGVHIKGPES